MYYDYLYDEVPYPGEDALVTDLTDVCFGQFEGYVARDYETSILDFTGAWPDQTLWESGYRTAFCLLYEVDLNLLTGSAYQSGW